MRLGTPERQDRPAPLPVAGADLVPQTRSMDTRPARGNGATMQQMNLRITLVLPDPEEVPSK